MPINASSAGDNEGHPPPVLVVVTALLGTIQGSTVARSATSVVLIADDKTCRGAWGRHAEGKTMMEEGSCHEHGWSKAQG